jgi:hypothetical protein
MGGGDTDGQCSELGYEMHDGVVAMRGHHREKIFSPKNAEEDVGDQEIKIINSISGRVQLRQ